jgi:hypothetical protein
MSHRILILLAWSAGCLWPAVPSPREYLPFTPGDHYKLADYAQITGYFRQLERSSNRIRLQEFGRSSLGKPQYVAFISSPENLGRLDHYREISRKLALGLASPAEARSLSGQGRAIVWIDCGLHASEVAPAQHAPELAYKMIADESEEIRRIRRNVILLLAPVINPDGLDWIVHWYQKNLGTPYELAPLPWLYQKYSGHDNNRDWFMLNLQETRNVARLLFQEWFPQIVYNHHQAPTFPARIFVPPYAEPLNPHIPAAVMEGINQIGAAIKERLAMRHQPGAISYLGYDAWWNGGLRSAPAFHNMHGILTETAGYIYGTPRIYTPNELPDHFENGIPTREPTIFYEQPWLGGRWGVRDAIEYMLTADLALLELAGARSAHYLYKSYEMARAAIEAGNKGKPYAYIIPQEQWDASSAAGMLKRLALAGVKVRRSAAPFQAGGKAYSAGTRVLPAAQPFRAYLMDLLEPQKYPELKIGTAGLTKRPYDITGWTLSLMMGVQVDHIDDPFPAELVDDEPPDPTPSRDHRQNASFLQTADWLQQNVRVRWAAGGKILLEGEEGFSTAAYELNRPKVALYEPWTANSDAGWAEWLLDQYHVPHTKIHNEDLARPCLRDRFDSIILASQTASSILHGIPRGERVPDGLGRKTPQTAQRPEYTGGIEIEGLHNLDQFVRDGGALLALDAATELPMQFFSLGVRPLLKPPAAEGEGGYYSPGSLLRITVDTANPIAFGMPHEAIAFTTGGPAFDISLLPDYNTGDRAIRTVAWYAARNLLASGWLSGEKAVLGKPILVECRRGKGKVVLYGFRPQFRGQSFGTFKLLLNAIYLASARSL